MISQRLHVLRVYLRSSVHLKCVNEIMTQASKYKQMDYLVEDDHSSDTKFNPLGLNLTLVFFFMILFTYMYIWKIRVT